MQRYVVRRLLLSVFVVVGVATLVFLVLRVDSSQVIASRVPECREPFTYEQCVATAKTELGLDKPLLEQYRDYMSGLIHGDLGNSFKSRNPVLDEIKERAGPTIELGLLQVAIAVLIALPVGIISAARQDTWVDYLLRFLSIAFLGIPSYVVAILLIVFTARYAEGTFLADWFGPQGSYAGFFEDPLTNLKIMLAPALIGGLATAAVLMRFLRAQMLEVLRQDYIRTAWSKGLRERSVIVRHALKNALIPVLTLIGILLGGIVSANVVLESIYRIPGIGNYVVFSLAQAPDIPVIQGVVIVVAVSLVFVNLLVDIACGWLDPRIRYS